jgi:hypothetical protein
MLPTRRRPRPRPALLNSAQGRADGVPFGPGESLRFSIEYGMIKAGTAWLEVAPMEHYTRARLLPPRLARRIQ